MLKDGRKELPSKFNRTAAGDLPAGSRRGHLLAAARYLETAADALTDSAGELQLVDAGLEPEPVCGLNGHECAWCAAYRQAAERRLLQQALGGPQNTPAFADKLAAAYAEYGLDGPAEE